MAKLAELAASGSGWAVRQLAQAKAAAKAKASAAAAPEPPTAAAAEEAIAPAEEAAAPAEEAAAAAEAAAPAEEAAAPAEEAAAAAEEATAAEEAPPTPGSATDAGTAGADAADAASATSGAAGARGFIDREAHPKGEAPPTPGWATGADAAGASAADAAGAAADATDDTSPAKPPWWHHRGVFEAVAKAAADAALADSGDPEAQQMAIDLILERCVHSDNTRSPEEVSSQEAATQRQLDLEADARRAEAAADAARAQELAAADAARAQEAAAAAAQAHDWRLAQGMAWADVPMGTSFSQRDAEEHGLESFPHMQEAKAAFERRMLNKRPLAESTADPQAGAGAPEEGPTVSDETVVSPSIVPMATDQAVPAGAELPETPPVKASPAQPLASKPLPTPAFQAPAPPQMPGSSYDPIPSKPMPKLLRIQPCKYTDVRLRHGGFTAGAVPQFDADAVAREQAARFEAAQRAARQAEANAPARDKPVTAQEMEFYMHQGPAECGRGRPEARHLVSTVSVWRWHGQGQTPSALRS